MLYVYLRSGEVREVPEAVAARTSASPEGDILECLREDDQVVARFLAAEVFFYSRMAREEFRGLAAGPPTNDEESS